MPGRLASMDDVRRPRAAEAFSSVTREDIQQALRDLDRGVEHPFGPSLTYDLVYEGRHYPPKAVVALAAKNRSGINLIPGDFPGGEGTSAFDTLRRLGFEIVHKEISTGGPVKFERSDCEIFDRFPNSVSWADVSKPDQERFKSIRSRLKQIAMEGSQRQQAVELQAATSLATPNGRSPKEIWSCVYPAAAGNKSYAFQVALILSQRGGELCFCLGSGTSQIRDVVQKQQLMQGFRHAKAKLRSIPKAIISAVEQRLEGRWFYRQSWLRVEPIQSEFNSLSDWLEYASRDEVTAASVSRYMTPDELEITGEAIQQKFSDAVETFRPLLDFPFSANDTRIQSQEIQQEPSQNEEYLINDLANDTGFDVETLKRWKRGLERKGQAILYGPPGTGKTFIAERLAKHIVSGTDGVQELVQFHPAYSYEDFMQGIRPETADSGVLSYTMAPGRFMEFCARADSRKGPCVLIIDEINRANLSRVFGELMYLLEYRNEEIPLAGGGMFHIPRNVRLIGTMNTADRSIALVDHALRRRFAFIPLHPEYDILLQYQKALGFDATKLIQQLKLLNKVIADPHYEVGITFFLRDNLASNLGEIWQMEIEPYLEEFFFDQPQKFEQFRWETVRPLVMP
jgi:MoxR-like ATPase